MTTFAIACVQSAAGGGDNLDLLSREVALVVRRYPWVRMILFGELLVFGPRIDRAEPLPGPTEAHLAGLARRYGIWLVPGSLYESADGRVYNTAPVIDPTGTVIARHRKIYPFLPYERGVQGGARTTVFDVPGVGRFGLSICYDMWFPETTRAMICAGAEIIVHPSLTNTLDRDLELAIARASAGTNQCYFLDVNSTGELGYGRSILVGPEGDVLHQAGRGPEIMPIVVDLDRVRRTRRDGLLGLGQVLKSFRDTTIDDPHHARPATSRLADLGPLGNGTPPLAAD